MIWPALNERAAVHPRTMAPTEQPPSKVILSSNDVLWSQVPARSPGARSTAPVAPRSVTLDDVMRAHILEALRATNGVLSGPHGAAARLGMKRTTLASRMAKHCGRRPTSAQARPFTA